MALKAWFLKRVFGDSPYRPQGRGWGCGPRFYGYEGKWFLCYLHFTGWDHISLGVHFCLSNIEIHLPFAFLRVGAVRVSMGSDIQWIEISEEDAACPA